MLTLNQKRIRDIIAGHSAATRDLFALQDVSLVEGELRDLTVHKSSLLPEVAVDVTVASKREKLATITSRLPLLTTHDSLYLLRNVVSTLVSRIRLRWHRAYATLS